ncbi:MAG: hypothetical protein AB1644_04785 [Candidatus Zixiibacteriota bacterium]
MSDTTDREDRISTTIDDVRIRVNGKALKLNKFVKSVVGNTVLGMVSSLRLDGAPKTIEIAMKARRSRKTKKK